MNNLTALVFGPVSESSPLFLLALPFLFLADSPRPLVPFWFIGLTSLWFYFLALPSVTPALVLPGPFPAKHDRLFSTEICEYNSYFRSIFSSSVLTILLELPSKHSGLPIKAIVSFLFRFSMSETEPLLSDFRLKKCFLPKLKTDRSGGDTA
jgi:hypothetical protein